MFLRVADVLMNLLIVELRAQDATQITKFKSYDPSKYKHCDRFQRFVANLGIPGYSFYIGQTSKRLKIQTLTGPEKLKVFRHIQIADLLPSYDARRVQNIQWVWTELLQLNETFSKWPEDLIQTDIDSYKKQACEWGKKFIGTEHSSNVTPYIHALMNHVSELMRLHGGILQFTQQGLEKYNDVMTKDYFRCTSHHGDNALLQIMQKQNRLEHLRDLDVEPSKCKVLQLWHHQSQQTNLPKVMQGLPTLPLQRTPGECRWQENPWV